MLVSSSSEIFCMWGLMANDVFGLMKARARTSARDRYHMFVGGFARSITSLGHHELSLDRYG